MGTCIIFYSSFYTLFVPAIFFTHLMKHVFVNETCHNHEGVLVLHSPFEVFYFSTRHLLFFFVSLDVKKAV